MFLRNEMKFLIIFLFLAAAASFGLATKTESHNANPTSTVNPDSPTGKPNSPTGKPDSATGKPNLPTSIPGSPTSIPDSPTGIPDSPKGKPNLPTDVPNLPTGIPNLPTSVPTNSSASPSVQEYADAVSKTANNPISALGQLSPQCQTALVNIVANPEFFQCIPIQSLIPLLPATDPKVIKELLKDPAHKLPPLLEPVLDGICAAPKCSDKGISGALKAINEGCKKDAKNPLIVIATGLITFYSPLRDSICFKTNKGEFCVFDTLKKVLSLPKPPVPITNTFFDNVAFAEPKAICTPCNKAILNTVVNFIEADTNKCVEFLVKLKVPVGLLPLAKLGVALKCGFQFLDGDAGHPEKTDPDDFEYQLSIGQDVPVLSGASNLKGIGFMTMIGTLLASILMI